MRTLNLGILAHVDAGKTSLTERLLLQTGAIDRLGSVDDGDTHTDTLAQERRRGITIRSAVACFEHAGVHVNLIDTPGHPDFIAEVERALSVLDGAVLVVSAVEGVQPQTRVILRVLRRMAVPTLVFVNKVDRVGADPDAVVAAIPDALATWTDFTEALAEHDDQALAAFLADRPVPADTMSRLVAGSQILPAWRGSAVTGEGVDELLTAITTLLPTGGGDPMAPVAGTVFAMERNHDSWLRLTAGTLTVRDQVGADRVGALRIDGRPVHRLVAGQIARVSGLHGLRLGDRIGAAGRRPALFPPPTLRATIARVDPSARQALHTALRELSAQDPLIDLRLDGPSGELSVALYGEVQREVIRDTLLEDFDLAVVLGPAAVLHRERPAGSVVVAAGIDDPDHHEMAGLELRLTPAEHPSVSVEVPVSQVPLYVYGTVVAFTEALHAAIGDALSRGPQGWPVDAAVTVTAAQYQAPGTGAGDVRRLAQLLVGRALASVGTLLCEPVERVDLDAPAQALSGLLRELSVLGARVTGSTIAPSSSGDRCRISALLPADRTVQLELALPGLTSGDGALERRFAGWRPVTGGAGTVSSHA